MKSRAERLHVANSTGTQTERQIRSLLKGIQRAIMSKPGPTQLLKLLEHQERLAAELKRTTADRLRRQLAEAEAAEQETK